MRSLLKIIYLVKIFHLKNLVNMQVVLSLMMMVKLLVQEIKVQISKRMSWKKKLQKLEVLVQLRQMIEYMLIHKI